MIGTETLGRFLVALMRGDVWGALLFAIVLWFLPRYVRLPERMAHVLRRVLRMAGVLALLYAVLVLIGDTFGFSVERLVTAAGRLFLVLILSYLGWELVNIAGTYLTASLPVTTERERRRVNTLENLLRWIGRVLILFVATAMVLDIFQVNVTPLVASAGVVGLAVGLGSQKLVQDIVAGVFIMAEGQFDVGDSVEVAGIAGTVEEMTLRVTKVRDFHGVLHIIPNSAITTVSNRTHGWARAIVEVGVAYDSDLQQVMDVLTQVGEALYAENPDGMFLEAPTPLGPEALADSSINFRLIARVKPGQQWTAQRVMRRRIKEAFDAAGITIPFPQLDVHLQRDG